MEEIKRTILLVDNDPEFLGQAQESLENAGYRVIVKMDCYDALAAFSEGTTMDMVIIYDMMPDMDGLEFMAALRKKALSIPVILLTDHADIHTYLKALNLGAYDYINKPVGMPELNVIVKAAFRGPVPSSPYTSLPRSDSL
jgi:DNA-binding response OmpR family regulator